MNAPESKRRWYHPTPGWLVVASLTTTCALLLWQEYLSPLPYSRAFRDFLLFLVLLASSCAMLLALLLWFIAALLFRWRFQFTIRSPLLLVVAVAIPCSLVGERMREAKRQEDRAKGISG